MSQFLLKILGVCLNDVHFVDELAESFNVDLSQIEFDHDYEDENIINQTIKEIYKKALSHFSDELPAGYLSENVSIGCNYRASYLNIDGKSINSFSELKQYFEEQKQST